MTARPLVSSRYWICCSIPSGPSKVKFTYRTQGLNILSELLSLHPYPVTQISSLAVRRLHPPHRLHALTLTGSIYSCLSKFVSMSFCQHSPHCLLSLIVMARVEEAFNVLSKVLFQFGIIATCLGCTRKAVKNVKVIGSYATVPDWGSNYNTVGRNRTFQAMLKFYLTSSRNIFASWLQSNSPNEWVINSIIHVKFQFVLWIWRNAQGEQQSCWTMSN